MLELIAFFTAGRGQAGADLAPAPRAHRLARGGPDPLGHPEGLRPRRGRLLDALVRYGGYAGAREHAALRLEGRDST